jgi:hypothetical protein
MNDDLLLWKIWMKFWGTRANESGTRSKLNAGFRLLPMIQARIMSPVPSDKAMILLHRSEKRDHHDRM